MRQKRLEPRQPGLVEGPEAGAAGPADARKWRARGLLFLPCSVRSRCCSSCCCSSFSLRGASSAPFPLFFLRRFSFFFITDSDNHLLLPQQPLRQHAEAELLGQKHQQHARDEGHPLAVADLGVLERRGAEDAGKCGAAVGVAELIFRERSRERERDC